jgi:hypothetical protein
MFRDFFLWIFGSKLSNTIRHRCVTHLYKTAALDLYLSVF